MATAAQSINQEASRKSVDASLWWDSFTLILDDLEHLCPSSEPPPSLVKRLKDNHAWFLDTLSCFKPPNDKSREALNSQKVKIGEHELSISSEVKDAALRVSDLLCLDEVQSYILVKRSVEHQNVHIHFIAEELHAVLLQYYAERQCLLKCVRHLLMHALYAGNGSKESDLIRIEALKLISEGLECKLLLLLEVLLSSNNAKLDIDLFTLWAEETLIEDCLVLDIIFLAYYESLCFCARDPWKKLCSLYKGITYGYFNFEQLAVSSEATHSVHRAKVQLLLILVETLDLENLLQMIHDATPFRQDGIGFSLVDVQEMDELVSSFSAFGTTEAAPLFLIWAVFLCLLSSLPGKVETNVLMDVDHVGYVHQAFEAAPLNYFLDILQNEVLKSSDGPVAGYLGVLRTFISAFIAAYEINLQPEDNVLKLILDILCKIYRGEESLCNQFWDRSSFVDGPIRCLLCSLEGEFPFRTMELVCLLSALSEGAWPTECVYNFLDKSVGISSLFEITSETLADPTLHIIEAPKALHVPGVEGLLIPRRTRGHVLKGIAENTVLVRWEQSQSGLLVLLLKLAQQPYLDIKEEVLFILDLVCRLVTFNTAVCYAVMDIANSSHAEPNKMGEQIDNNTWCRVNVVEIICNLIRNLPLNHDNALVMSMGITIMAKMLKCSPSHVATMALKANLFDGTVKANFLDVGRVISSRSLLLSGKLAKMLSIDIEENDNCFPLSVSVLNFTMQLVDSGLENDMALALVVFSLQYILVNHEMWKYKSKFLRWKVTLKALEFMKKCVTSIPYSQKLGEVIKDMLLHDSSIHNTLFRVICMTPQILEPLYVSRLYEPMEIEGLQLAMSSVLDILFTMLSNLSEDISSNLPVFYQALLSTTVKPVPVVTAVLTLISYFRSTAIQVGAARVASLLFVIADSSEYYLFGTTSFGLDNKQVIDLRHSISSILSEGSLWNEELFVATLELLISAANYQPAFLINVIGAECMGLHLDSGGTKLPIDETTSKSKKTSLIDELLQWVEKSDDLINRNPHVLVTILNFLKTLWKGAPEYTEIIEQLSSSPKFWKQLSNCILQTVVMVASPCKNLTEREALIWSYKSECLSSMLELTTLDVFLQKRLLDAELIAKQAVESSKEVIESGIATEKSKAAGFRCLRDALLTWCQNSALNGMIKSLVSCEYDLEIFMRAKVATSLFMVHVMGKLAFGDAGSLSLSLIKRITILTNKLYSLPAFVELLGQYSRRGYSEGKELNTLILNDLYYHLQGELNGRKIDSKPFRELAFFLIESDFWQVYLHRDKDLITSTLDVYTYDTRRIKEDLGLDIWAYSEWKAAQAIAETMLLCVQYANSMKLVATAKFSALRALTATLAIYREDLIGKSKNICVIPEELILSWIDHTCQCFHATFEALASALDGSEDILNFLRAQAELILHLCEYAHKSMPLSVCALILNTAGYGIKVLSGFRPLVAASKSTLKLLLLLLLSCVKSSCLYLPSGDETNADFAKVCNECLKLMPALCNCIEITEHCALSLVTMDLIARVLLAPKSWFPIIQKHLCLQHITAKLQHKSSADCVSVILKFFLTLARVREGAEMLLSSGFLSSLKVIFAGLSEDGPLSSVENAMSFSSSSPKIEKSRHIWGLGLAVVTAIICSLRDSAFRIDVVHNVVTYFLAEKAYLVSYYLNAPDFQNDDCDKDKVQARRRQISLTNLKETEHTLVLMCVLEKCWNSWIKGMKGMDSQLREKSIHLLAFISKGTQRLGESSSRTVPLLCLTIFEEEFDDLSKPSSINCRNGWFGLAPFCCGLNSKLSDISRKSTALAIRGQANGNVDGIRQTHFSDVVALQMYRIAFLVLKFLCLRAESAAKRAEEVGFVDIAQFPELPMPGLLHGLQDQSIAIVTELCGVSKSNQLHPEILGTCLLLLQILEMSLCLEHCVSQIYSIRPVSGRADDFSNEVKLLIRGMEEHAILQAQLKSLKETVFVVYPAFLQSESFL